MPTSTMTDEQLFAMYAAAALSGLLSSLQPGENWRTGQPVQAAAETAKAMVAEHREYYPRAQRHASTEAEIRPALEGI
jgi:hypothetical protein